MEEWLLPIIVSLNNKSIKSCIKKNYLDIVF